MFDALLSYSSVDRPFVVRLRAALEAAGKTVWLDKRDIQPAEAWDAAAFSGIDSSHNFLFVISPDSVKSLPDGALAPCGQEIARAVQSGKRLIPIHYRNTPYENVAKEVRVVNDIDFREADSSEESFAAAFQTLITAMNTDLAWVAQKTLLQVRAQDWENKGKDKSRLLRGDELKKFEIWLSQSPNQPTPPTQFQTQYLLLSRQEATRAQRRNQGITIAVATVLLAVAIFAFLQRNAAVRQTGIAVRQARIATAGRLAATALNLKDTQLDVALLLSLEGTHAEDTYDTRNAMLTLFQSTPALLAYLHSAGPQDGFINSIAFSPDGRRFATGTDTGTVQIWDTGSRQARWVQPMDEGYVQRLAFSPDGATLAVLFMNGPLQLWEITGPKPVLVPHNWQDDLPEQPSGLAYNSDGTMLAVSGRDGTTLWTLHDRQCLGTFPSTDMVWSIAFSPTNPVLLASVEGGRVSLEDASTGDTIVQLPPQNPEDDGFRSIAFSRDGTLLAAAAGRGQVALWQVNLQRAGAPGHGRPLTLRGMLPLGDRGLVMDLAFSPDGRTLAAVSNHGAMRQWDVSSFEVQLDAARGLAGNLHSVAFSPDGKLLLSGLDYGTVLVWDPTRAYAPRLSVAPSGPVPSNPPGKLGPVCIVAFSTDSRLLAAGDLYGGVYIWDIASRHLISRILGPRPPDHFTEVRSLAFTPDGREVLIAVEGWEGIQHWEIKRRAFAQPLPPWSAGLPIPAASIASSGLLARIDPAGIRLADRLLALPGAPEDSSSISLSADGRYLAVGGDSEGNRRLWDLSSGKARQVRLEGTDNGGGPLAFNPDGTVAAAPGYLDDGLTLWHTSTGKRIGTYIAQNAKTIEGAAFSADGERLALAIYGGAVQLLDVTSLRPLGPRLQRDHEEYGNGPSGVAFSPDGKLLAYGSDQGTVSLWDADPKSWAARACRVANRNLSLTEWHRYLGDDTPYRRTCPDLPDGEGVSGK